MKALVGLALTVGMLVIAGFSLLHAASEAEPIRMQTASLMRSSLTAEAMQETSDGVFRAAYAQDTQNPDKALLSQAVASARESFAVDPLAVTSARSLILGSLAEQDPVKAQAMMETAVGLNKRDIMSLVWLSQRALEAEDLETVAGYLDMTLRTSARARDAMMKPLVNLIQDGTGLNAVSRLIKDGPVWEPAFWGEFIQNPVAMSNAVEFFQRSDIPLSRLSTENRGMLYANLLAAGLYDEAYALAAVDSDVDLGVGGGDGGRILAKGPRNPFGWTLVSKGAYASRITRGSSQLTIDTSPSTSGVAADRIVRLGGGSALAVRMTGTVPRDVIIDFGLSCLDGSQETELAAIRLREGESQGTARAPGGSCSFGRLTLAFNAGNRYDGELIVIDELGLNPM